MLGCRENPENRVFPNRRKPGRTHLRPANCCLRQNRPEFGRYTRAPTQRPAQPLKIENVAASRGHDPTSSCVTFFVLLEGETPRAYRQMRPGLEAGEGLLGQWREGAEIAHSEWSFAQLSAAFGYAFIHFAGAPEARQYVERTGIVRRPSQAEGCVSIIDATGVRVRRWWWEKPCEEPPQTGH